MLKKMFTIEGNIGSGKSSLLKLIENNFKDKVQIVQEPVVSWQAINNDPSLNLLDSFYKDPKRWAYTFQMHAFYSRVKQMQNIKELMGQNQDKIIIQERSVYSDKFIFAMNGKKTGLMNDLEWALYNDTFDFLVENKQNNDTKVNGYIYLQTNPKISYERIQKRARDEEKSSIGLDYIQAIHDRHEEWFFQNKSKNNLYNIEENNNNNNISQDGKPVLVVSGDQEFVDCQKRNSEILQEIEKFIK